MRHVNINLPLARQRVPLDSPEGEVAQRRPLLASSASVAASSVVVVLVP